MTAPRASHLRLLPYGHSSVMPALTRAQQQAVVDSYGLRRRLQRSLGFDDYIATLHQESETAPEIHHVLETVQTSVPRHVIVGACSKDIVGVCRRPPGQRRLEGAVEEVCLPGYSLLLAEITGIKLRPIEPEGFDIRVHVASEKAGLDSREKRTAAAVLQSRASKAVRSDVGTGRGRSNPVVDEVPGRPVFHHAVLRRCQRMVRPMTGVRASVTSDPEDVGEKIRPDGRHEMRSIYRRRNGRVAQRLEDEVSLVRGGGRRNHRW